MTYTNEELIELFKMVAVKRPFLLSSGTVGLYTTNIGYFLSSINNKNILSINRKDVKDYMLGLDIADSTYNTILASIRCLYKVLAYTLDDENITDVTFGIIPIRKFEKEHKVPLTKVEQDMMLKYAKNSRDYAFIITMLNTGLRIHELIALTLDDYNNRDENGKIHLKITKGSKQADTWFNKDVCDAIDKYLLDRKECEYDNLFISNSCKPMERVCCSRMLKTVARRSGMDESRVEKINNHALRSTFATNLSNNGVDIQDIAKLMRHSNIQTSFDSYIEVNEENLIQAMACNC